MKVLEKNVIPNSGSSSSSQERAVPAQEALLPRRRQQLHTAQVGAKLYYTSRVQVGTKLSSRRGCQRDEEGVWKECLTKPLQRQFKSIVWHR